MNASSVQPAVARSAANADVPMELVTDLLQEQVRVHLPVGKADILTFGSSALTSATCDWTGVCCALWTTPLPSRSRISCRARATDCIGWLQSCFSLMGPRRASNPRYEGLEDF